MGGAPPPLPPGGGGGPVADCKWEIFVKVHSQEKFWPQENFDVQLTSLDADRKIGAVSHSQTIKMVAKTSPEAHFKGNGPFEFGVTSTAPKIAKEPEWIHAKSKTSKKELDRNRETVKVKDGDKGKKAKRVDLVIRHPLKVYLQFKFKDPEDRVLTFPKNFPVGVYNKDTRVKRLKTDEDGKVEFEFDRKYDWFTLKFGEEKKIISNGDGSTTKTELKGWGDRKDLSKAEAKFFSPPNRWGLIEAVWEFSAKPKHVDGSDAYKEDEGKIYVFDSPQKWVARIGETGTPIELTLNPHWQFTRLEYFDRFFGHSDHGHKRVNTPPLLIQGFHRKGKEKTYEGAGHWTLSPKDVDDSVHCVPWIRQKEKDGAKKDLPDTKCLLRTETAGGTFARSVDKDTRKVEVVKASHDDMKPSANRLKLYDLPEAWESAKYFARYKDGGGKFPGKFYEDWTDADIRKSRAKATPIIFSLDDVVLTDTKFRPLKLDAADRFAFFYHRFKVAYDQGAADVTNEGLYKPDTGNQEPYLSTVKPEGPKNNYVTDYPNWIRLAAGLASVWDIFDKRTTKEVLGARAGVRWYDAIKSGKPAGSEAIGWPGVIDKKYFAIQPYFGQKNAHFRKKYTGAGAPPLRDGRLDMVLARCCDVIGGKELMMNMQYSRFVFNFQPGSAHALNPAAKKTFRQNAVTNIMARWNGDDGVGPGRAELVPQDGAALHQGEVIYFIQGVPDLKSAHVDVQVDNLGGGRASMGAVAGTASVDDTADVPKAGFSANDFAFAHEHGHASSFPDEYAERLTYCSHRAAGIGYNTPGDQFVSDGFFHDLAASLFGAAHGAGTAPIALMCQNNVPRNRYFWHNAEFCRKHSKAPFFAKLGGALPDYKLPTHPNAPQRNYVYWPIRDALNKTRGAHGKFDVLLHAAGKDHYTVNLLPNPPVDGFMAIVIKIDITFPAAAGMTPGQIRDVLRGEILNANGKFTASGDAKGVPTDAGSKTVTLSKVSLRLSPRFIISNSDGTAGYAGEYAKWRDRFGVHFTANVVDNAGKVGPAIVAPAWTKKHTFTMAADFTDPAINAKLAAQTQQFLQEMLGMVFQPAGIAAADLKDIAAMVIKKNANVV